MEETKIVKFDDELSIVFQLAEELAKKHNHKILTVEHVVIELIKLSHIKNIFETNSIDLEEFKEDIMGCFDIIPTTKVTSKKGEYQLIYSTEIDECIDWIVEHYLDEIETCGIDTVDFVESIFYLKDGYMESIVEKYNIDKDNFVDHVETQSNTEIELVGLAKVGKIDKTVGRKQELERIIQIFHRKKSCNVILVGESGVGKTQIVEGLALQISQKKIPLLNDYKIYPLDISAMLAGTSYRGEFEEKLNAMITKIKNEKNAILFIDEIHMLLGAGAGSNSNVDASNILKSHLTGNDIKCIGATTYDEYKGFQKDKAFSRRFKKIDVLEPSKKETVKILKGMEKIYSDFHNISYETNVIENIVDLSVRHINDRHLPDKAIDIMDELGAKLKTKNKIFKTRKKCKITNIVTLDMVKEVISNMTKIPLENLDKKETDQLRNLSDNLSKKIFGQDEVIYQIVKQIKIRKAGLGYDNNSPIAKILMCGTSGVGKTELAKQLANELKINFVKYDMSEYSTKETANKLIGSAPGYVGYEQGGVLTDTIIKHPYSIILFDEIEKSHSSIYDLLLQVLEDGVLTDNQGRIANFKNTIILLSSNAGTKTVKTEGIGFSVDKHDNSNEKITTAVNNIFSPEFRNRLDKVVYFNKLDDKVLSSILTKFLKELSTKDIKISISKKAREFFVEEAKKEDLGGRPLKRILDKFVSEKIADKILFEDFKKGSIKVDYIKNKIIIK